MFSAVSPAGRPLEPSKSGVQHRQTWYSAHIHHRNKGDLASNSSLSRRSQVEGTKSRTDFETKGIARLLSKKGIIHTTTTQQQRQQQQQQQHQQQQQQQQHSHRIKHRSDRSTNTYARHQQPVHRAGFDHISTSKHRQHVNALPATRLHKQQSYVSTHLSERLKQRHRLPHYVPSLEDLVHFSPPPPPPPPPLPPPPPTSPSNPHSIDDFTFTHNKTQATNSLSPLHFNSMNEVTSPQASQPIPPALTTSASSPFSSPLPAVPSSSALPSSALPSSQYSPALNIRDSGLQKKIHVAYSPPLSMSHDVPLHFQPLTHQDLLARFAELEQERQEINDFMHTKVKSIIT